LDEPEEPLLPAELPDDAEELLPPLDELLPDPLESLLSEDLPDADGPLLLEDEVVLEPVASADCDDALLTPVEEAFCAPWELLLPLDGAAFTETATPATNTAPTICPNFNCMPTMFLASHCVHDNDGDRRYMLLW
jgi:hypothetical protein